MKTVNNTNTWLPNILDNLFLDNRLDTLNNYETFSIPAVNIIENLPSFVVELVVPGLQKEDFTIEVEEDTLKIASENIEKRDASASLSNREIKEVKGSKFRRREFNFKSFERSFKLPENINTEDIQAKYENGVLQVTLPKMEEKKILKKMIEIS